METVTLVTPVARKARPRACHDARDVATSVKFYGHWARECKKAGKEVTEAVHHANADTEAQPALLIAQVCNLV